MSDRKLLWANLIISGVSLFILYKFASAAQKAEGDVKGILNDPIGTIKGIFK